LLFRPYFAILSAVKKAYKFRIFPTSKQQNALEQTLSLCRELYNAALQERTEAYKRAGKSISYSMQQQQLPEIKKTRTDLKDIHSQVLQDTLKRLDKGFDNFFERVKKGVKAGYPRYKGKSRYSSFTYPQSGFEIKEGKLVLSKIGHIKIKLHRPLMGRVKTLTIKRTATGKWFAIFCCEVGLDRLPFTDEETGIDVGLSSFATLSNGKSIENPRFFRQEEAQLAKAQRQLSAAPKGSQLREEKRKVVARVHERIANKRDNFAHQESRKIVNFYAIIFIEALTILNMMKNSKLSKSIADAAWSKFFRCINYKAESAGRFAVEVAPKFTTQDCCICDHRQELTLSDRMYRCTNPACLMRLDRDWNASLNILRLGLQSVGAEPIEAASLAC
jgi:putative transposase